MKPVLLACLAALWIVQAATAAEKTFEITVAAGKVDRTNAPVSALLPVPADQAKSVVLKNADGKEIPAQITGLSLLGEKDNDPAKVCELRFVLPKLKAGDSLTLTAKITGDKPTGSKGFSWKDTPGDHLDLSLDDRPVLSYQYKALDETSKESRDSTFKVFHHLYDPEGKRLVTNGPAGLYPHHRGLFFGFNKITYGDGKKADTWHCTQGAFQGHEKMLASEAGPVLARHRVRIGWHGEKGDRFAEEDRELTIYNVPGGRLVEFASIVRTVDGPVKLDGDPQHAGFHFRADHEVAEKSQKETIFIRPDGTGKPGETRNWDPKTKEGPVNLPWNAMSFVLGGKRYTAAYLDSPDNPKEARGSEREYGRIGSYFEFEVTEKKPLRVQYRIWLQDGQMKPEEVGALDEDFAAPLAARVK
jgi:hypothetical protein